MINTQPPEKRSSTDGTVLELHSVFHTIQGEGPFSGFPSVFVRLTGCNLQCPACDTEYTSIRKFVEIRRLVDMVKEEFNLVRPPRNGHVGELVVITGGEPFRQNITLFTSFLLEAGFVVQVETNGTFNPPAMLSPKVVIVCSPKSGIIAPELSKRVNAYKYVLDAEAINRNDGLPTSILGGRSPARPPAFYKGKIYLSPMDTGDPKRNLTNVNAVVEICLRFGYILNLQLHKLINLP